MMREPKPIAVIGLQRSGTNFLQAIISENFGVAPSPLWKHGFPHELDRAELGRSAVVVVAKHPLMWFESCWANRPGVFIRDRAPRLACQPPEVALAQLYSDFYRQWHEWLRGTDGLWLTFEGLLAGDLAQLEAFLARQGYDRPEGRSLQREFSQLPASVQFSAADRQIALLHETRVDRTLATAFWDALDPDVVQCLDYRLESVRFSKEPNLRQLAYRLLESRAALSESELDELKSAATTQLQHDGRVLMALGDRARNDANDAEALTWYMRAVPALGREIDQFDGRTEAALDLADLLDKLAAICGRMKTNVLDRFQRLQTGLETPPRTGLAGATWYNLMSQVARRRGNLDEAIAHADEAARLGSDNGWYRFDLGRLLSQAGRLHEAEAALRKSIEDDPADAPRHFLLSGVLDRLGKRAEASEEAAAATNGKRVEPWFFHHYASLLVKAGRMEDAEAPLREAMRREPQAASHRFLLSDVLARQGRLEEAIALADQAIGGAGVTPWFFHHYGALLARADRLADAEAIMRKALALEPDDARHHFLLSDILAREDKLDEALAEGSAALSGKHVSAWNFHHYGALLARAQEFAPAAEAFRKALEIEPDNDAHREALAEVMREIGPAPRW